jgi:hypothetical protein
MRRFNKMIVVSLPRCATVSMCDGLGALGIKVAHLGKIYGEATPPHNDPVRLARMHEQIAAGDFDLDVLRECDGLVDYPACITDVFTKLDKQFPGSLFINVRRDNDIDSWLRSVEKQFVGLQLLKMGHESTAEEREFMRIMRSFRSSTFGQVEFDAAGYREAYVRHQTFVQDYFRQRPNDLLDIKDVSQLDHGFNLLAKFLECDLHQAPFPRVDDHSHAPRDAFMQAVREGRVQSQTGIEVEL